MYVNKVNDALKLAQISHLPQTLTMLNVMYDFFFLIRNNAYVSINICANLIQIGLLVFYRNESMIFTEWALQALKNEHFTISLAAYCIEVTGTY